MPELRCLCGSSYRSVGDYMLAIKMGWDIEYTHALLDLWENCLDQALDAPDRDEILERMKEEYGRTVSTRPDQADS